MAYSDDHYDDDQASGWTYARRLKEPYVIQEKKAHEPVKKPDTSARSPPSLDQIYSQVRGNQDPRAILGLESGCTEREVTVAFRKLALLLHPDKCLDEKKKALHQALFVKVDAAKDAILAPKVTVLMEEEKEETSYRPPPSPYRDPVPQQGEQRQCPPPNWCPRCGGYMEERESWMDDNPEVWFRPSLTHKQRIRLDKIELERFARGWKTSSGRNVKNARKDDLRRKIRVGPGYDRDVYEASRKDAGGNWTFTVEKKKETKRGVRESKRLNFWLDDDASYLKDEAKELNVEHEYILEEDEIPSFVTFNLGDWISGS